MSKPDSNIDRWELHHFIEVAGHLNLLKLDTSSAARLARTFRNLIHPGRAARLAQTCDRATAYPAVGALERAASLRWECEGARTSWVNECRSSEKNCVT